MKLFSAPVVCAALSLSLCSIVSGAEVVINAPRRAQVTLSSLDWTGPYLGGHVGYTRGTAQVRLTDLDSLPTSFGSSFGSLSAGVQIGYNYRLPSQFVVGVEGDAAF